VKPQELDLIKLMYDDLSARSSTALLTREVFDTFFHLNGLWSQEMFRAFDLEKIGLIKYEQFVSAIANMVKGSFEERTKLLYKFYDMRNIGGVSYT
jgi:Ca2+-binding EF-hand superfamily protein